jgi:hypothetical protein
MRAAPGAAGTDTHGICIAEPGHHEAAPIRIKALREVPEDVRIEAQAFALTT